MTSICPLIFLEIVYDSAFKLNKIEELQLIYIDVDAQLCVSSQYVCGILVGLAPD